MFHFLMQRGSVVRELVLASSAQKLSACTVGGCVKTAAGLLKCVSQSVELKNAKVRIYKNSNILFLHLPHNVIWEENVILEMWKVH